jgi:hypothetical protein
MARLQPVRPEKLDATLLLDNLKHFGDHVLGENEILDPTLRRPNLEALGQIRLADPERNLMAVDLKRLTKTVSKQVVVLRFFLSDDSLDDSAQVVISACSCGTYEVDEEVCASHCYARMTRSATSCCLPAQMPPGCLDESRAESRTVDPGDSPRARKSLSHSPIADAFLGSICDRSSVQVPHMRILNAGADRPTSRTGIRPHKPMWRP